ncbi:hypothetical protein YC2023_079066 [Brassica napus]
MHLPYCSLFLSLVNSESCSTLGQGLETSTYPGEVIFSIVLAIAGLLLFALLIGNMQTYLQSLTVRLEEMRVKRLDSEQWMHHRMLPPELRERDRRYDQYKWLEWRHVELIKRILFPNLRRPRSPDSADAQSSIVTCKIIQQWEMSKLALFSGNRSL